MTSDIATVATVTLTVPQMAEMTGRTTQSVRGYCRGESPWPPGLTVTVDHAASRSREYVLEIPADQFAAHLLARVAAATAAEVPAGVEPSQSIVLRALLASFDLVPWLLATAHEIAALIHACARRAATEGAEPPPDGG